MSDLRSPRGRIPSVLSVGVLIGVLATTVGYAFLERGRNAPSEGAGGVVLKLGHTLDTTHPVHLAMERMARRVAELSSGAVQLRIAPNGQLGTEVEVLELVQRGALAMTKVSTAPLENFTPAVAVFGLPYIFRDEAHFWKVIEGPIGAELLAASEPSGLVGLCWYDAGARSFYTKNRAVLEPEDLAGLKLRVQSSSTALRMVEALGGSPTPLPFGELYTGLQQGLVDGAENNPPSFWTSRHFEVCREYSLDEHTRVPDILLVSTVWWKRLSEEQQGWLKQAAEESAIWERQAWRAETEASLEKIKQKGVTIHHPNTAAFAEQVGPLLDSYTGTPLGDLLARVRETR